MAWLPGWNYRKSKTIIGSTIGPQIDYQLKLTVYKGSGTDTNTTLYCNNNVKDDFSDLRFTSLDGITIINYWIESYTPGVSANIWIKVGSIPVSPGTVDIYVYYGNPTSPAASDGISTFIFFDDFDDLNYNGWTVVSGQWSALNGYLQSGTPGVQEIKAPSTSINGVAWEWRFKTSGSGNSEMFFKVASSGNGIGGTQYAHRVNPISGAYFDVINPTYATIIDSSWTPDTNWHDIGITRTAGGLTTLFLDGVSKGSNTDTTSSSTSWMAIYTEGVNAYSFDNIRIRKYVSPEPLFSSTGPEETSAPVTGLYILSTPSGASIYVDNVLQTGILTPATITNIAPGPHTYKLTLIGYYDATGPFTIVQDQTTTVSQTMTLITGDLSISSTPSGASIYIDNVLQTGITTPATITGLSPGDHTYKLILIGYADVSGSFTITAEQITTVSRSMTVNPIRNPGFETDISTTDWVYTWEQYGYGGCSTVGTAEMSYVPAISSEGARAIKFRVTFPACGFGGGAVWTRLTQSNIDLTGVTRLLFTLQRDIVSSEGFSPDFQVLINGISIFYERSAAYPPTEINIDITGIGTVSSTIELYYIEYVGSYTSIESSITIDNLRVEYEVNVPCQSITTPTADPTTLALGGQVILSSTVTPLSPMTGEYIVEFMDGASSIAQVTTVNKVATYVWTPTALGNHYVSSRVTGQCTSPDSVIVTVTGVPPSCIIKRDEGIYNKTRYCYIGEGIVKNR